MEYLLLNLQLMSEFEMLSMNFIPKPSVFPQHKLNIFLVSIIACVCHKLLHRDRDQQSMALLSWVFYIHAIPAVAIFTVRLGYFLQSIQIFLYVFLGSKCL